MPLALLMMFAFAIGATCLELQTGVYAAGLAEGILSAALVPITLFVLSGFIAFSTGTWGTFAIMLPIGFPWSSSLAPNRRCGSGIGDHGISDTTIKLYGCRLGSYRSCENTVPLRRPHGDS